ncbi:uncharacterized protein LOC127059520 [Serinus canaria]|uniref:uncharacterized protein LOC127059520 n=1 Tax=Serinus canaria TaxID=9135 RepID=UPI0021CCCF1D|nr:uncharacterized protein LOC127059520 [Serinus canaria]
MRLMSHVIEKRAKLPRAVVSRSGGTSGRRARRSRTGPSQREQVLDSEPAAKEGSRQRRTGAGGERREPAAKEGSRQRRTGAGSERREPAAKEGRPERRRGSEERERRKRAGSEELGELMQTWLTAYGTPGQKMLLSLSGTLGEGEQISHTATGSSFPACAFWLLEILGTACLREWSEKERFPETGCNTPPWQDRKITLFSGCGDAHTTLARPHQVPFCCAGWEAVRQSHRCSGSRDSAAGKLQRRLPGPAPQNGPPLTGVSQRMEQLQPPGHSCEIRKQHRGLAEGLTWNTAPTGAALGTLAWEDEPR